MQIKSSEPEPAEPCGRVKSCPKGFARDNQYHTFAELIQGFRLKRMKSEELRIKINFEEFVLLLLC
ncbi:MAG: hypothetical protein IJB98_02845 [Clostridia bacterium]|nr:hypothetical protein [Clostridia bacterium]